MTPASDAIEMDGGDPPYCTPVSGVTRDLNVMVPGRAGCATLAQARLAAPWDWAASARGLFTLHSVVLNGAGWQRTLAPYTLAWDPSGDTGAWSLAEPLALPQGEAQTRSPGAPAGWWIGLHRGTPSIGAES